MPPALQAGKAGEKLGGEPLSRQQQNWGFPAGGDPQQQAYQNAPGPPAGARGAAPPGGQPDAKGAQFLSRLQQGGLAPGGAALPPGMGGSLGSGAPLPQMVPGAQRGGNKQPFADAATAAAAPATGGDAARHAGLGRGVSASGDDAKPLDSADAARQEQLAGEHALAQVRGVRTLARPCNALASSAGWLAGWLTVR
jgi:hypothetical protein